MILNLALTISKTILTSSKTNR